MDRVLPHDPAGLQHLVVALEVEPLLHVVPGEPDPPLDRMPVREALEDAMIRYTNKQISTAEITTTMKSNGSSDAGRNSGLNR